nr:DUF4185 domain-containing protein [Akkermansiaceae bacterium]
MKPMPSIPQCSALPVIPLLAAALLAAATASTPITAVIPQTQRVQKWHDMCGDSADPFWAADGKLYHFTCDGRGFGKEPRNLCLNRLDGEGWENLQGVLVNPMDEYGKANDTGPDGATWKVCGQECIDGVFYAFVTRNIYGNKSGDPLMRQTSFNTSLIKSTDRGRTWTRSAKENHDSPMWPGPRFGAPGFIHYGRDGGQVNNDLANQFVYAISNNGFWNGGDDYILARVRRGELPRLNAADWSYWQGGDGLKDAAWSQDIARARPILERPSKLGWTPPVFIPALNRYLLTGWYVSPTLKKWFEPGMVTYEFFESPHPWGPWTHVSSFDDRFMIGGHMYGPSLVAKYQVATGNEVEVSLI